MLTDGRGPTDFRTVMDSWMSQVESVTSAIVEITGRETLLKTKTTKNVTIRLAFDKLKKRELVTFDWPEVATGAWSRSKDTVTQKTADSGVIELLKSTDRTLPFVRKYDPRRLPFSLYNDLKAGYSDEELETRLNVLTTKNRFQSTHQGDVFVVENVVDMKAISTSFIQTRSVMTCRRIPGGTVIEKFEYYTMPKNGNRWVFGSNVSTVYRDFEGHTMPCEIRASNAGGDETTLRLTWSEINKPLADSRFDIKSLPVDRETLIVDARASRTKPIIVGKYGEDSELFTASLPSVKDQRMLSLSTWGLIALLVSGISAVAVMAFVRRRRVR
jgi:hypothetical protein